MKLRIALLLALLPSLAFAQQGAVLQSGTVTPKHPTMWIFNNTIGDAGGAGNGLLSELGITNTGTPFCINDAPITAPGGYHQLCLGANANNKGTLSYSGSPGTQQLPFQICVNGICQNFPITVTGGVTGPSTSTAGDISIFANATGNLLADSNVPISALGTFVSSAVPVDDTQAVQNCLNSAGVGQSCHVSGTVKLLSSITIPGGTTLDCGIQSGAGLNDPTVALLLTGPRLLVTPSQPIIFGGPSATLQNCVIVPNGMAFPQTSSSGWTGTAIDTHGAPAPQIINVAVAGFDTCIDTTSNGGSTRPLLRRVWYDCNGVTKGGSVITGNNGDLAILEDVSGQVLATSALNCQRVRQGTGLVLKGSAWGTRVIVQDYQTTEIEIENTGAIIFQSLWTDFPTGLVCSAGTSVGVSVHRVTDLSVGHLDLNATNTGMLITNQGPNEVSHFGDIFLNGIVQDGIVLGQSSGTVIEQSAGVVQIDMLNTNQTGNNVGRFALNYLDTFPSDTGNGLTGNTTLTINGGLLTAVHGMLPPYLNFPATTDAFRIKIPPNLITDLAPSFGIYGAPTVTCTGLGSGSCAVQGSTRSSPWSVSINMMPTGSPSLTGTAVVTFPISASFPVCVSSYGGGWTNPAGLLTDAISARQVELLWTQAAPLTAGNAYGLMITCAVN